jgi:hypothetical protein
MKLDFQGSLVDVRVDRRESSVSPHSGANLERLTVSAIITGEAANESFGGFLQSANPEGVPEVAEVGAIAKRWSVGNHSWSYTDGNAFYHHTIELIELETLVADRLCLGDLEVVPYAYAERFDDDRLVIETRVALPQDQHDQLKVMLTAAGSFQVIRRGISDEPIEMRFGLCYWSPADSGFKHTLVLVDVRKPEVGNGWAQTFQWVIAVRQQSVKTAAIVDSLLDALVANRSMTPEEITAVRDDAQRRLADIEFDLFRVRDIDTL